MNEKDLFAPPSEEEISNDELFAAPSKGELSDEELFAAPEEGDQSEESLDINPAVAGGVAGGVVGLGAKKVAEMIPSQGMQDVASRLALESIGASDTPTGKKFIKSTIPQEIQKDIFGEETSSLFTPRDLGQQMLEEDLFDPESILTKQKSQIGELEELLKQSKGTKSPQELSASMETKLKDAYPDVETKTGQKADKYAKDFDKRFTDAPDKSAYELDRMKRATTEGIDYGPSTKKTTKALQKLEASVFREAAEELIEEAGDPKLLKQFKDAKDQAGRLSVLRKIVTEDAVRDYMKTTGTVDFQDALAVVYNRPDILVARRALKSQGLKRNLAKGLNKAGKSLDKLKDSGFIKKLPIIGTLLGAGLSYSSARAEGLEPMDAAKQAAQEEGLDAVLGVASPSKIGAATEIEKKLQAGEELTPEEAKSFYGEENVKRQEEYDREQEIRKNKPTTKPNKAEIGRLENFLSQYSDLSQQSPSVQNFVNKTEQLLSETNENKKAAIKYDLEQQPAYKYLMRKMNRMES